MIRTWLQLIAKAREKVGDCKEILRRQPPNFYGVRIVYTTHCGDWEHLTEKYCGYSEDEVIQEILRCHPYLNTKGKYSNITVTRLT
jgi:hypothetical protein